MSTKKGGDILSLLLASRQVFLSILDQQSGSLKHYARTSSIPRAAARVLDRTPHAEAPAQGSSLSSHTDSQSPRPIDPVSAQPYVESTKEDRHASKSVPPPPFSSELNNGDGLPLSSGVSHFSELSIDPPSSISPDSQMTRAARTGHLGASFSATSSESAAESIAEESTDYRLRPAAFKQSKVPSSRVGRLWHYGSLAAGVGVGAVGEAVRRVAGFSDGNGGSVVLSPGNIERIVSKLTRMRGAALKLGQMLSIQDNSMLPKELENILLRVQNTANYMPDSQLQTTLSRELGPDWRSKFGEFELMPIAAASIGQVHRATLLDGQPVAVKVQYPGVANSIDNDLDNLRALILFSNFLPKGLYLDNTIRVARKELAWECDYKREAEAMEKFRDLIKGLRGFNVPKVISNLTTAQVLTTEFVEGLPVGSFSNLPQRIRDSIGERILRLCLRELFEFRFMQTDPNWSNFLYDARTDMIHLLDFGAAREFDADFTQKYMNVLHAASEGDREGCAYWSKVLGFLTGMESQAMTNAHVNSLLMLAEPFSKFSPAVYDFGNQDVTNRVRAEIPLMLRERLTPPPDETYSLHRKLSGAFLLCTKLRSRIRCREIFEGFRERYVFDLA
ncbi:hypothetical protein SpCBS45565_g06411 [Spizellomyces sp. 'palustris']|nr:hypothetical protein SpCBS45565_g06411 [Spizellomyces sp. 'palustris']